MKLYTEEQVRQIFKEAQHLKDCNEPLYHMFEDLLIDNNITPIELPNYKEQLDRIEQLLLSEEASKRNRFRVGPL